MIRAIQRAAIVLAMTVGLVGAAELALYMAGGHLAGLQKELFAAERPWGTYGYRPNGHGVAFGQSYSFDATGVRRFGTERPGKPVLLLGDSVAFGVGIPSDRSLGERLSERLDAPVIDASVIGYGLDDYVLVLRYWLGPSGEPIDRVVLVVCLNDLSRVGRQVMDAFMHGTPPGPRGVLQRVNEFLRDKSRLYLLVKNTVTDPAARYFEAELATYSDEAALRDAKEDFSRIARAARGANVPLHAVLAPYAQQAARRDPAGPAARPTAILARLAGEEGLSVVDLLPAFSAAPSPKALYLWGDPMHFSQRGIDLAAQEIADRMGDKPGRP